MKLSTDPESGPRKGDLPMLCAEDILHRTAIAAKDLCGDQRYREAANLLVTVPFLMYGDMAVNHLPYDYTVVLAVAHHLIRQEKDTFPLMRSASDENLKLLDKAKVWFREAILAYTALPARGVDVRP